MTKKSLALSALAAALFLVPAASQAQSWTGAPGAAVIDEDSAGIYQSDATLLGYRNFSASTSPIIARFNLTDVTATGASSWSTLKLRYVDNGAGTISTVEAQVLRITGTGASTSLATCTSTDSATPTFVTCALSAAINFTTGNPYVVEVRITRTSTSATPFFLGAQVY